MCLARSIHSVVLSRFIITYVSFEIDEFLLLSLSLHVSLLYLLLLLLLLLLAVFASIVFAKLYGVHRKQRFKVT